MLHGGQAALLLLLLLLLLLEVRPCCWLAAHVHGAGHPGVCSALLQMLPLIGQAAQLLPYLFLLPPFSLLVFTMLGIQVCVLHCCKCCL